MKDGKASVRSHNGLSRNGLFRNLFRGLFGTRSARRRTSNAFGRRRFESLESRLLLYGVNDHGVNGPHLTDPTYDKGNYHVHAQLSIYVNGEKVAIPQWGGVATGDLIHTHDTTGRIHMHKAVAGNTEYVTLGDVFDAWKAAPSNANPNAILSPTNLLGNVANGEHIVQMFVNGVRTETFQDYQIHDEDSIVLAYTSNPILVVNTTEFPIPIELFEDRTPITVANFLDYVNEGDYANSIFHRYIPGFVLQGGGFKSPTNAFSNPSVVSQFTSVPTEAQIQNEFDNWAKVTGTTATVTLGNNVINLGSNVDLSKVVVGDRIRLTGRTDGLDRTNMFDITAVNDSANTVTVAQVPTSASASNVVWAVFPKVNVTGTLAMAKVGDNPNSATSQFFVNLVNNDANLDAQNGGFTVFGQILDPTVLTDVALLQRLSLYSATLTGNSEIPPVTTSATGSATMALNKANNQFDLSLTVQGLSQSNLTSSHIHSGSSTQEGAVIFDVGAGTQYTASSNQLTRFIDNGAFPSSSLTNLNLGQTYLNVHTIANSDGEIRGQLIPVQGTLYTDVPTTAEAELVMISSISGEGVIKGRIFNDADRDGILDQTETGRQSFTVFSDTNNNGTFNTGEPSAASDVNGNYVLRVPAGQHTIRMVATSGFAQTAPASSYSINVLIGGETTARDFGVFEVPTPTGVNLLDVSDTGSSATDNITNLNNGSATAKLQFQVTGVVDGAVVRLRADGVTVSETTVPTGSNGTITITTDGITPLSDGVRNLVATQTFANVTSQSSTALPITIDTTLSQFTSTPPTTALISTPVVYNAANPDEGQTGFSYSLVNAPSGATIHSSTGEFNWTPLVSQIGHHQFEIVARDTAGNTRSQAVTLDVTKIPQVRFRYVVTNASGTPLTEVNIGDSFQLRVFVTDVRSGIPENQKGVFAAYEDVTFDRNLATATAITHDTSFYTNSPSGTISAGLIDEVGSFGGNLNPPGGGEFFLYSVNMTAVRSGTLVFTGDAPDILPAHAIGIYGVDTAIPLDEVDFGRASIQIINPNFKPEPDVFNFDEDTSNNPLNVLANDGAQTGRTLSILAVGARDKGGSVTIAADGKSLLYTPAANFFGEERFTYTVSDGSDEAVVSVSVQVVDVNDVPPAISETLQVDEDATNVPLDVLANELAATNLDRGAPLESLRVSAVGLPSHGGTVTVGAQGGFVTYTPPANFSGTETFTYTITDRSGSTGLTAQATATVTVRNINDPPVAVADTVSADEDSQNNIFNVKANDNSGSDPGETLTISSVGTPSRGGVVTIIENGGKVNYTPAANVFGTETFTYTISDGNGGSATTTVTVNLAAKNDVPDAVNDTITVGKSSQNNVIDVLANDKIAPDENETLTISAITQGNQGGTVEIIENGAKIRYKPAANYLGSETFTYTVRDPGGLTDTATVTVTVRDFLPSSLAGAVYIDADNDGVKDTGEQPIANVQISLTGTDDFGSAVSLQVTTDANGAYSFTNLAPGNYKLKQIQPTGNINNLPILDGKDTIGTQGGTVANDEFTIDLNENVNGTGNNFGETTGFKVTGTIKMSNGTSTSQPAVALSGVPVQLFAANAQNQPTGSALKTSTLKADGTFSIEGIAPGSYIVQYTAPIFLEGGTTQQVLQVSSTDAVVNGLVAGSLQAKYINYRSFMNSTPRTGLFAAVNVSANSSAWTATDSHWSGFTEVKVVPSSGNTLHIEATQTSGAKLQSDISRTDSRVHVIATEGSNQLLRLKGGSTEYNLQAVTTTASGEGESSGGTAFTTSATRFSQPLDASTMFVTPGILDSSPDSLGENNGIGSGHAVDHSDHDHASEMMMVVDTSQVSSSLETHDYQAAHSSSAHVDHVDAVMAEGEAAVMGDDGLVERLAASRSADDVSEDEALDSAIEELMLDNLLLV